MGELSVAINLEAEKQGKRVSACKNSVATLLCLLPGKIFRCLFSLVLLKIFYLTMVSNVIYIITVNCDNVLILPIVF